MSPNLLSPSMATPHDTPDRRPLAPVDAGPPAARTNPALPLPLVGRASGYPERSVQAYIAMKKHFEVTQAARGDRPRDE